MLRRRPIARMAVGTAVVAGTASAVAKRSAASQQAAAAQQAPSVAPEDEDPYAKLKELGALHDQGILSDEEFAAEKAKLLG